MHHSEVTYDSTALSPPVEEAFVLRVAKDADRSGSLCLLLTAPAAARDAEMVAARAFCSALKADTERGGAIPAAADVEAADCSKAA